MPAATAAGWRAFSRQPAGAITSIGRWAPAQGGASGSVRTRTAKKAADFVTESGQLRLPSTCGSVPAKSRRRVSPAIVASSRRRRSRSAPSAVGLEHVLGAVAAVGQRGEGGAGAALGVGEDLAHPGAQRLRPRALGAARPRRQGADPVRRLLGAEVGEALARVAHLRRQPLQRLRGGAGRRDHHALLVEAAGEGGHRRPASGRRRRHGGRGRRRSRQLAIDEDGGDEGDVGQVGAAAVGVVEDPVAPGCCSSPSTAATASGIEPRWTGMCSACITSSPAASKSAVEQSWRSLMLAE